MSTVSIDYAHLCEMAFLGQSGNLNIIEAFDRVSAREFPTTHPRFSVVVGVSAPAGEHRVSVEIINEIESDPEKKIITQASGTLTVKSEQVGHGRFFMNFVNTTFPNMGRYNIYIYIGEETRVLHLTLDEKQARSG